MGLSEAAFTTKLRTVRRASQNFYDELLENERLPPDELAALQNRRAAGIARLAAEKTTFYPRLFAEHGIRLDALEDPREWERIPILTRAVIKENTAGIVSSESSPK